MFMYRTTQNTAHGSKCFFLNKTSGKVTLVVKIIRSRLDYLLSEGQTDKFYIINHSSKMLGKKTISFIVQLRHIAMTTIIKKLYY